MEFIKPSIENTEELRRILKCNEYRCCDFSTGTLILWSDYYGYTYTVIRDFFVIWMTEYKAFSFPMYVGEKKLNDDELRREESTVVGELMHFFEEHEERPRFLLLSSEQSKRLEELYPDYFEFSDNEDYRDYIYNTEDLAELSGRHYHGKRNHIYRFEEDYPDYKVEDITEENIESCKNVEEEWTDYELSGEGEMNGDRSDAIDDKRGAIDDRRDATGVESDDCIDEIVNKNVVVTADEIVNKNVVVTADEIDEKDVDESDELQYEKKIIFFALDHMKELGLDGCAIRIPDTSYASGFRTVAFAIGERLTDDCFVVHFEKAFSDVPGAYSMINQQFAEHAMEGYRYVNREDDAGSEGLRRAKLSYHPVFLMEMGIVTEKENAYETSNHSGTCYHR